MQKKIIALAVAALASSAAFAQTNVTVYGVMDLGQAVVKSSDSSNNQPSVGRLDSNSSYIGFKGVEDLGNGLKAVFQYETGFAADTAGGLGGGRDTYVGLAGGFGTVAAGTLTHPLRAFWSKAEILPGGAGVGTINSLVGTVGGLKTGADDRATNAIAYISPSMSGFTGTFAYINGENKNNEGVNQRAIQVAGQYEGNGLFAGLGYHRVQDTGVNVTGVAPVAGSFPVAANDTKASVLRGVVVYTLPTATKLSLLVDRTKAEVVTSDVDVKRTAWALGVSQPFGKSIAGVQYARAGKLKADGDSLDETKANLWTLHYGYNMSKRTLLQARYTRLSNDDNVNYNFYNNAVSGNGEVSGSGANYTGFMVGVRHSF